MGTRTFTLELSDDLVALLGGPDAIPAQAREALVLDLLRAVRISQGKAAELLGITRYDILDLMAQHEIPSGPETADEMREELDHLLRPLAPGAERR
ncbi:MAG TPA: UPF0175 family protein [Thermomicrobiales bacterium]|nr:UPF0175 family protein [Thermomicrobiales bacterium]